MKINKSVIARLRPCEDRFNNFKREYPKFSGTPEQFLSLENITVEDKIWVLIRLITMRSAVLFAYECAKSIEHLVQDNGDSVKCLNLVKLWLLDSTKVTDKELTDSAAAHAATHAAAYAAHAAYAASAASAAYAARAAAAAGAAYEHTTYSIACACADIVAYSYACRTNGSYDKEYQQDLNLLILLEIINA